MTTEQRLRAIMQAHDVDAPTRVPWPPAAGAATRSGRRRPPARLLLAAAVIVVLAAAGTWLAVTWPRAERTATPADPVAPLTSCPATWGGSAGGDPWVPGDPGVPAAATRLAPAATPTAVLVCGYVVSAGGTPVPGPPVGLTGQAALSGDFAPVAADLAYLPRGTTDPPCAAYVNAMDLDNYLVGLSYPDGTLWVSAPGNHCSGSGNGAFRSSTNVSAYAEQWLTVGSWSALSGEGGLGQRCRHSEGRLGQDVTLVPADATSLQVCRAVVDTVTTPVTVPADRVGEFAAGLDGSATVPDRLTCPDPGGGPVYTLVFGYDVGPTVVVQVQAGCSPGAANGSLAASPTPDLLASLQDLFR